MATLLSMAIMVGSIAIIAVGGAFWTNYSNAQKAKGPEVRAAERHALFQQTAIDARAGKRVVPQWISLEVLNDAFMGRRLTLALFFTLFAPVAFFYALNQMLFVFGKSENTLAAISDPNFILLLVTMLGIVAVFLLIWFSSAKAYRKWKTEMALTAKSLGL